MTPQTPGGCSIHLTYAELMEREAINYITGCMFKFYHLSFFHQKSHCFLTLKILFCVVYSQSTVRINFTLPLLRWTLPDKPVVCNQANIDPFNICSNNVQAKACYWWHTIFICFLHTKRNKKNSQRNLNLIVVPKYKIPTYQNLKPRVNELCDTRIPDVIFNFCVPLCFLFMEEKFYSASKLIDQQMVLHTCTSTNNGNSTKVGSLKSNRWVFTQVSRHDKQDSRSSVLTPKDFDFHKEQFHTCTA